MISVVVWVLYEGRGRGKEVAVLMVVAVGRISSKYVKVAATCKSVQTPLKVEHVTKHNTNKSRNICCLTFIDISQDTALSSTSNPNHLPHPLTAVSVNAVPMPFHQRQATRHVAAKLPRQQLSTSIEELEVKYLHCSFPFFSATNHFFD
jgi:hypothetical protein